MLGHKIHLLDVGNYNQLPTNEQVLCPPFYDLKSNKMSLKLSCLNVINNFFQIWHTANINSGTKCCNKTKRTV